MNTRNIFSFVYVYIIMFVIFGSASLAHAQVGSSTQPYIQTYSTATSSTTVITLPSGYKSEVIYSYDGNQMHTIATSTPLTAQDIQNIQQNIQKEESAMQQLFQDQQALFNQQEQMFQNLWANFN